MGTSGILSPFAKIEPGSLYFNDEDDPYTFYYNLVQDLTKKFKDKGKIYIKLNYKNPKDFYDAMKQMEDMSDKGIEVYGTSTVDRYEVIINENTDIDDKEAATTFGLQKKRVKNKSLQELAKEAEEEASEDDSK